MHDLTWAQAMLVCCLTGLAFIAGFLFSNSRKRRHDRDRVPHMYRRQVAVGRRRT